MFKFPWIKESLCGDAPRPERSLLRYINRGAAPACVQLFGKLSEFWRSRSVHNIYQAFYDKYSAELYPVDHWSCTDGDETEYPNCNKENFYAIAQAKATHCKAWTVQIGAMCSDDLHVPFITRTKAVLGRGSGPTPPPTPKPTCPQTYFCRTEKSDRRHVRMLTLENVPATLLVR